MSRLLAALALVLGFGLAAAAEPRVGAPSEPGIDEVPLAVELPLKVHLSLRVLDVAVVKELAGEANLEIEVTQSWVDPRTRFDPVDAGAPRIDRIGERAEDFLKTVWRPGVTVENQIGDVEGRRLAVSHHSDGRIVVVERWSADFRVAMDMSAFPFDRQKLAVVFAVTRHPAEDVVLVADEEDRRLSRVAERLTVVDWTPRGLTFANDASTGWNARNYARLTATVTIARDSARYWLRLFLPIVATLAVSLFVLWVPGLSPSDKGGLVFSSVLALAALSFTFEASFPGSMSLGTPIAAIISVGYLYLVLVLVADTLVVPSAENPHARFHRAARLVRAQQRWALPAMMAVFSFGAVARALPV